MKRAVKTIIVSLAICLSLVVSGLAQPTKIDSDIGSAVFQRDKPPEKPKERDKPKDEKRGDDRRDDKDKRKKPEFF
jgi:hypothetical protein